MESMHPRLTRIVATVGPASNNPEMIESLIRAGVEVFRLNFSHGSHDFHRATYDTIRAVSRRMEQPTVILQDISGPKLRIGEFVAGEIILKRGATIKLVRDLAAGDDTQVGFVESGWFASVHPGERVMLGDGQIVLTISDKSEGVLTCEVNAGGIVRSKWGLNFPDSNLQLGAVTEKDRKDIAFGLQLGVDVMALSFVQTGDDIRTVKQMMDAVDLKPLIIAKIERHQALNCLDDILDEADGLMVARGDLGIDLPMEQIPTVQKQLIKVCRERGKVVITATQMLESMTTSPRPTRAEVTDVANAVYDGTDAVMLSGETAVGDHPALVVETMNNILREAEAHLMMDIPDRMESSIEEGVVDAVSVLVQDLGAAAVIVPYTSGTTTARISRRRLGVPIIAGARSVEAARRMRMYCGVFPLIGLSDKSWLINTEATLSYAMKMGWIELGDNVVATGGFPLGKVGVTNFVRAIRVGEEI